MPKQMIHLNCSPMPQQDLEKKKAQKQWHRNIDEIYIESQTAWDTLSLKQILLVLVDPSL